MKKEKKAKVVKKEKKIKVKKKERKVKVMETIQSYAGNGRTIAVTDKFSLLQQEVTARGISRRSN